MLGLNVAELKDEIARFSVVRHTGRLRSVRGIVAANVAAATGELCRISRGDESVLGEVIGLEDGQARIMPYKPTDGLRSGARVVALGRKLRVGVGSSLLGRVVNGVGEPVDERGAIAADRWVPCSGVTPPSPLDRRAISQPFVTGQRVIDGLLTIGQGQRMGLFSGSGVGKSTLLGEIARGARSDLNVIALVGERGREVRPFIENCLGPEGLARSVVVVATSDEAPLMRLRAASTAIAIADYFRWLGANVLFLFDSVTRLAMAQREIGLLLGEPPSSRGYTPSVFQLISSTLEQLGTARDGAVTAILSVLVEGDDMDEPIADAVRATVDGHIVLDRTLAERGHFPAVDVAASISRLFLDISDAPHQQAARKLRAILQTLSEVSELVRIGAYVKGTSPEVDRALELEPALKRFLTQELKTYCPYDETRRALHEIARAWPFV
jgi:flagellum-specific ATP synthase